MVPAGLARRRHGVTWSETSRARFLRQLHHTLGANAVLRRARRRGVTTDRPSWRRGAPRLAFCRGLRARALSSRMGTAVTDADRGASASSSSTTAAPKSHPSTPPSWPPTTGIGIRAPTGATTRVSHAPGRHDQRACRTAFRLPGVPGGAPLRRSAAAVFLTTTGRIRAHDDGILGAIWRTPGAGGLLTNGARVCWLPRLRPDARDAGGRWISGAELRLNDCSTLPLRTWRDHD